MIVTVDNYISPSLNVSYIDQQFPSRQANNQFSLYRAWTDSPDSQKLIQVTLQLTAHCLTSHLHGTI